MALSSSTSDAKLSFLSERTEAYEQVKSLKVRHFFLKDRVSAFDELRGCTTTSPASLIAS